MRRKSRARIASFIALGVSVLNIVSPARAADDQLLEFLVKSNEASREKIRSATYAIRYEVTLTPPGEEPFHDVMKGTVTQSGDRRLVVLEQTYRVVDMTRRPLPAVRYENRVLYTPTMAAWFQDRPYSLGEVYRFTSSASAPADMMDNMKAHVGEDVLLYAFGTGQHALSELIANDGRARVSVQWSARETRDERNKALFVLERVATPSDGRRQPLTQVTLDPDAGFLVTEAVRYSSAGQPVHVRRIQNAEVAPGVWFPRSINVTHTIAGFLGEQRAAHHKEDPAAIYRTGQINLDGVQINGLISDDVFTLASLRIPENRGVAVFENGQPSDHVFHDGDLLPVPVAKKMGVTMKID